MDERGPDTPGGGKNGWGVDAVVWIAVVAVMIGLAGGIAWVASNTRFELPEVTFTDQVEEVTLIEPVPPVAQPRRDASPAPSPEPKETLGPNGEVLRRPVWVRQPMPYFPEMAMRRGIERGAVMLRCETLATGEFGAGEVVSETPPGAGFAEVALASMREARVKPYSIDGFETDSSIQFTIRFEMAPEP